MEERKGRDVFAKRRFTPIDSGKNSENYMFCLYKKEFTDKNKAFQLNEPLQKLQKKIQNNANVSKAFVYGSARIQIKEFEETRPEVVYYIENKESKVPLSHVILSGLAMLKEKSDKDEASGDTPQNYLYVITDTSFPKEEVAKIKLFMNAIDFKFTSILVAGKYQEGSEELKECFSKRVDYREL